MMTIMPDAIIMIMKMAIITTMIMTTLVGVELIINSAGGGGPPHSHLLVDKIISIVNGSLEKSKDRFRLMHM